MAFIFDCYCNECEQTVRKVNGKCPDCEEKKRRMEMETWKAMTTDEKLLDIHKRLLELEKSPPTY